MLPARRLAVLLDRYQPCAIHIATEGPLGHAARRYCLARKLPFTTAFHTRFPEYVKARTGMPLGAGYSVLRRFHAPSSSVMVATLSLERDLEGRGFRNLKRWTRGVDTDPVPSARQILPRSAAADPSLCRAGCGRKERRSVSETGSARQQAGGGQRTAAGRVSSAAIPRCISPGRAPARTWPATTPPPMSSSSPAAPTPSAWCFWKRSPPACRWQPFPCRGR